MKNITVSMDEQVAGWVRVESHQSNMYWSDMEAFTLHWNLRKIEPGQRTLATLREMNKLHSA